jgi:MinD superfamily P-loop ATPase
VSNNALRSCGSTYSFCNGVCETCSQANMFCTNTTLESQEKPTKDAYEESKKMRNMLSDWIRRSRSHQNELLDELMEERNTEKDYLKLYEQHRNVIRLYEMYEEVQNSD